MLPISASVSPASPFDTAPTGRTSTRPARNAEALHLLDDLRGVGDRIGVRHRVHRGEATERRRARAGLHRLGVLTAGLAQVRVQIDEAGQQDQTVRVDLVIAGQLRADGRDDAVVDEDVGLPAAERRNPAKHPTHTVTSSAPASSR